MTVDILRSATSRARLASLAEAQFGDVAWIEFDSMINVRPSKGNRSRSVEDEKLRDLIHQIVAALVDG